MPIQRLSAIPVQIPQPPAQPWIVVTDHLQVALEDVDIGHVESDHRGIKANVRLGDVLAKEVRRVTRLAQVLLQPVQRFEKREEVCFVHFLRRGKADLVDAVVDRVVNPLVHLVNLLTQVFGTEAAAGLGRLAQVLGQQVVEFGVEHADDLAALVVDDRLGLLIPERRDREAADVVWVGFAVQVAEGGEAVEWVFWGGAVAAVEDPAVFGQREAADDELDDGFEALEGADEVSAVRPGTAPVEVEDIAVLFGGEFGVGIAGDEVAELAVLAAELAVLVGMLVDFCLQVVSVGDFGGSGGKGNLTDFFWHFEGERSFRHF